MSGSLKTEPRSLLNYKLDLLRV